MMSKNTKKILSYLLRNFEFVNINQVSRKLKISVGSAFNILNRLEKSNLISYERIGNAKYYKINLYNDETKKICELILLEEKRSLKGYSKLYANEIKDFGKADLIVLFGSVLRNSKFNDVDILFVTDKIKETNNFCLEVSKIKSKPVVGLIMKERDLIKEIKNKKEAILEIVKTGVVLKGESKFLEVIRNAKE